MKLATRRNVKKKGKEKEKKKMEIVRDKKRFFEYFETVRHVISSRRSRLLDSPSLPSLYLSFSFNPSTFPPPPPSYTRLFHSLPLYVHEQREYWVFAVTRLTKQYADIGNLPMAI